MLLRLLVVSCLVLLAASQQCGDEGDHCVDSGQCCGGCCFNAVCVDTYRSCLQGVDVCKDHPCEGEENCIVFVPPACRGCEPIPICH